MILRFVFFLLIGCLAFGCNSNDDDSSSENTNPCELNPFPGVAGVTYDNFSITSFDNPNEKGYHISANLINSNDFSVIGEPRFVVKEHGSIITIGTSNTASATSCLEIDANSNCSFELTVYLLQNEDIDNNITLLCFYYYNE
ncbi:hypothetical protein AB9K26_00550 [Psychroserpens sp. XS_ASV72]|uniref:hypothetical protein n=1 Tax=Psychroserpens sp. XS_ASV72 TaxID=3241293 RepID=UPI0035170100